MLTPGTIIVNSWGWEQTNIDFYQVVRASANFVILRRIGQQTTETLSMQGNTVPLPDHFIDDAPEERHAVRMCGEHGCLVNFKHGSGYVWDGKPEFCSWYA